MDAHQASQISSRVGNGSTARGCPAELPRTHAIEIHGALCAKCGARPCDDLAHALVNRLTDSWVEIANGATQLDLRSRDRSATIGHAFDLAAQPEVAIGAISSGEWRCGPCPG